MSTTTTTKEQKVINRKPVLDATLWVLRIVVGGLFIFSGLVKANDPHGLANKMTEFLEPDKLNIPWLMPHVLMLSIMMIAFEIIAGIAMILGIAYRAFSFLIVLLTAFFTFLTAYVYYWDVIMHNPKVRECGCFGDCIKISNSATFWKDIALLIGVLILFIFRKRVWPLLPKYPNLAVLILFIFFAFGVQWYTLEHLPFYDCMPYKIGNNIPQLMQPPAGCISDSTVTKFYYKNLKSGEVKEFTMTNYPWEDTLNWAYSDRKDVLVRQGNCEAAIKDFKIADYDGNDYTDAVLQQPGYTFILFLKDPAAARTDNMDHLKALFTQAQAAGIQLLVLSSASKDETEVWRQKWQLPGAEFYTFDGTASKTAIRSDPGLMLLEQGTIRGKWSFRDYPSGLTMNGGKVELKK